MARACAEIKILLIDDDENFRTALAANLRDDGHDVHEYGKPDDVPALAALGGFSVVLTDYQMPMKDGLAFADAFHALHPTVPIVLVTALSVRRRVVTPTQRDFVHWRRKPVDYDELHVFLHHLTCSRG
jgi:DNA-binding NtrC family response regulator